MARFGCCAPLDKIDALHRWGYDYIELPTSTVKAESSDPGFREVVELVNSKALSPEAFNCFVPAEVRLVGPDVDMDAVTAYLETALSRTAALGARVIVIGSGDARRKPDDFPADKAQAQLLDFFSLAAGIAEMHSLTVTIEHLNSTETNTLNRIDECFAIARRLNRPNLGLTIDLWHVACEGESHESLVPIGDYIGHVHVADTDRNAPGSGDFDFGRFFGCLKDAGYDGRVSVECNWADFDSEAPKALDFLKSKWG